jgi:hypothetical protein
VTPPTAVSVQRVATAKGTGWWHLNRRRMAMTHLEETETIDASTKQRCMLKLARRADMRMLWGH